MKNTSTTRKRVNSESTVATLACGAVLILLPFSLRNSFTGLPVSSCGIAVVVQFAICRVHEMHQLWEEWRVPHALQANCTTTSIVAKLTGDWWGEYSCNRCFLNFMRSVGGRKNPGTEKSRITLHRAILARWLHGSVLLGSYKFDRCLNELESHD
jgi:hypothetical protein